jgi:hypothetical protein
MQIEQIGSHIPSQALERIQRHKQTFDEIPEPQEEPQEPTLSDDEATVEQTSEEDGAKGVLRLLQEGHFKGVADIRLRINFYDELAAIEGAQLRTVSDEQIGGLTESLSPNLQGLVDSGKVSQEQADEANSILGESINDAVERYLSGEIQSKDDLSAQIRSAFDAFVAFLSEATSPPAEDTQQIQETVEATEENIEETSLSSEQTTTEQTEESEQSEPAGFVEEMTTAFDTVLANFINSLRTTPVLPELTPPKGNGVAYQKFLEIYNDLYGLTNETPAQETTPLDSML